MATKQDVIEEILDHTIRQKESEGILSSEQLQQMLNTLGRTDIKIMTEKEYFRLATYFAGFSQLILRRNKRPNNQH